MHHQVQVHLQLPAAETVLQPELNDPLPRSRIVHPPFLFSEHLSDRDIFPILIRSRSFFFNFLQNDEAEEASAVVFLGT